MHSHPVHVSCLINYNLIPQCLKPCSPSSRLSLVSLVSNSWSATTVHSLDIISSRFSCWWSSSYQTCLSLSSMNSWLLWAMTELLRRKITRLSTILWSQWNHLSWATKATKKQVSKHFMWIDLWITISFKCNTSNSWPFLKWSVCVCSWSRLRSFRALYCSFCFNFPLTLPCPLIYLFLVSLF